MKRVALFAALACSAGCSNAPIAGFLDNCFPSKAQADAAPDPRPSVEPGAPGAGPGPQPKSGPPLPPPDFDSGAR